MEVHKHILASALGQSANEDQCSIWCFHVHRIQRWGYCFIWNSLWWKTGYICKHTLYLYVGCIFIFYHNAGVEVVPCPHNHTSKLLQIPKCILSFGTMCISSEHRLSGFSSCPWSCSACRWAILQPREPSDLTAGWRVREQASAVHTIRKSHTQDRNNNCTFSTTVPPVHPNAEKWQAVTLPAALLLSYRDDLQFKECEECWPQH